MANVAFKKGLLANLPKTYTEGTFYVTTNERAIYLDVDGSTRIRIGDFQEVENLEALQGITNKSTTALYYVKDINVLAKYNGTSFVQINLDTGATSIEVVGDGNAVTAASYNPATRKITLTKGATYTTADDVDGAIDLAIGELGNKEGDTPYANVKDYVDTKIADVVASSIEGLGELASKDEVAESDLEATLAAKINGKADSTQVATDIDAAKTAVIGTASDASTVDTIKGAKKHAEEKATAAQTAAETHADEAIAALDVSDSEVATKLVSAVSETDGKITVTRRALVADDIPEIAQSKVTGLTTALAGKQDTLVFNTTYNAESNKAATMQDVQNAVADLSGAMHYEGNSTTDPAEGEPTVAGHEGAWAKGDVVTYNAKEYVYDGSAWRELGDESSFAVRGSITNSDIAAGAAIDQSKIAGLTDALAAKATPADITTAINGLDVPDEAVAGQVVSAVVETDGKIAVSRRALVAADIPELAQDKITGLTTALAGKQDAITFETAYNASTNKAATMADVDAAETAAKAYTDTALTWGSFDDLT